MAQIFYDSDESDSFHLIENDTYETKAKLEEFIKWIENKVTSLKNKFEVIKKENNKKLEKEAEKISDKIDDLKKYAQKAQDKLKDDKEVSKEHLKRLAEDAEKQIKEINKEIADFIKRNK